ncbi:uncharacterized protein [Littorina saxatilis]|uniref:uncharacterized protein n=1 Tax=Littorina saxatilis TaxID=31220 RepID=UPI0038B4D4B2
MEKKNIMFKSCDYMANDLYRLGGLAAASHDLQSLVAEAVGKNRWGYVTELGKHTCSVEHRDIILAEIFAHRQWQSGWQSVLQLVKCGVSCGLRGEAFIKAVEESQWQCVQTSMRLGVPRENRNTAIWTVSSQCQEDIAAELINLGVGQSDKEGALGKATVSGRVIFLVNLVKRCCDAEMTDFVLREAVKQEQWQLVGELCKMDLSMLQLEYVCEEAFSHLQWDLGLHLLKNSVSPSAYLVNEVFRAGKEHDFLDLSAPGALGKELRGLMLLSAVKYGQDNTFLKIMEQQGISDLEIVEAIKVAVGCRDENIFLQLVFLSKHSLQLFKQFCNKHPWKVEGEDSDVEFMCNTLFENDNDELALYAAVVNGLWSEVPYVICSDAVSRRMRLFALKRVCAGDSKAFSKVADQLLGQSQSNHRQLFLLAVRNERFSLAVNLYGEGVGVGDVKFAVRMILAAAHWDVKLVRLTEEDDHLQKGEAVITDLCKKMNAQDGIKILKYAVVHAMKDAFEYKSFMHVNNFCYLLMHCQKNRDDELTFDFFHRVFSYCMKRSVIHDMSDPFVIACFALVTKVNYWSEEKEDHVKIGQMFATVRKAFRLAAKHGKGEFILRVYKYCKNDLCSDFFDVAVEELVKSESWQTLEELINESFQGYVALDNSKQVLFWYMNHCIGNNKIWLQCAPILDGWLDKIHTARKDTVYYRNDKEILPVAQEKVELNGPVSYFADWCARHSCFKLTILLCLLGRKFARLRSVLQKDDVCTSFSNTLLNELLYISEREKDWATVVSVLKIMKEKDLDEYSRIHVKSVLLLCEKKRVYLWAAEIAFRLKEWAILKRVLAKWQDQSVFDNTVRRAARQGGWKLVEDLLPQSSQDPALLADVLESAMGGFLGSDKMAKVLMKQVNPLLKSGKSLLSKALSRFEPKPTKGNLDILHCCVEAGLFTAELHLQCWDHSSCFCILLQVLLFQTNILCLKLLHRSGTFSHKTLYTMQNSSRFSPIHAVQETFDYMDFATSAPLSLQDLCRKTVSQCISCHPGREERIQALPVPQPVKDFLRFSDLIQVSLEDYEHIEALLKNVPPESP